MNDTIILTKELIHSASSHPSGDGFTKAQLAVLGISWPPKTGWLNALIGKSVPSETFAAFQNAGDAKRTKNLRKLTVTVQTKTEPMKDETQEKLLVALLTPTIETMRRAGIARMSVSGTDVVLQLDTGEVETLKIP